MKSLSSWNARSAAWRRISPRPGSSRSRSSPGCRLADRLDARRAALRAVEAERARIAEIILHEGLGPRHGLPDLRRGLPIEAHPDQRLARSVEFPEPDQPSAIEDPVAR